MEQVVLKPYLKLIINKKIQKTVCEQAICNNTLRWRICISHYTLESMSVRISGVQKVSIIVQNSQFIQQLPIVFNST